MATIEQRLRALELLAKNLTPLLLWKQDIMAWKARLEAEARQKAQDDELARRKARRRV